MTRRPDWRERLAAHLLAARATPFDWGAHNCVLACADAVLAMTGADPIADLRGFHPTRFGALLRLRRAGFFDVAEMLDARLPRIAQAREGDLLALNDGPLNTTLIADGRGAGWGLGALGFVRSALPARCMAWGV